MKVRIIETGEIVEAKRFKDLTKEEIEETTNQPDIWEGSEIFTKIEHDLWDRLFKDEIEIIEE